MSWPQFRYHFTRDVENVLRYSIEEAVRRQCRHAGGGSSAGIAEDAVATFRRKMEKRPGGTPIGAAAELPQESKP